MNIGASQQPYPRGQFHRNAKPGMCHLGSFSGASASILVAPHLAKLHYLFASGNLPLYLRSLSPTCGSVCIRKRQRYGYSYYIPRTTRNESSRTGIRPAANNIPEAERAAVIKAALALIRDDLKVAREKAAAAKTKAKGKSATATPAKKIGRPTGSKNKAKAPAAAAPAEGCTKPVKTKKATPKRITQKRAPEATPETATQIAAE